jgi:hypothetical protein
MNVKTFARIAIAASIGLASASAFAAPAAGLLGTTAAPASADRTVALNGGVKQVAVDYGETVRFVSAGGQDFAVKFDGIRTAFDLNALAPAGALDHPVTAYVNLIGSDQDR